MIETTIRTLCDQCPEDKRRKGDIVRFALDGAEYETDLCAKHGKDLSAVIAEYLPYARKVPAIRRARIWKETHTTNARIRSRQIRQWASEQDIRITNRGRIPAEVIRQYDAVHYQNREVR